MITRLSDSSWIKIKNHDKVIYFDPGFMGSFQQYNLPISEFEEIGDLIFITHAHKDSLQSSSLEKIKKPSSFILAPKVCEKNLEKPYQFVNPEEGTWDI